VTLPHRTINALASYRGSKTPELENFLERAVILTRGMVLYVPLAELEVEDQQDDADRENPTLQTAEREHILRILRRREARLGDLQVQLPDWA
jgi:formate hydrogenlyase transcriptional activator